MPHDSISVLETLPGKLDIKRGSPGSLYILSYGCRLLLQYKVVCMHIVIWVMRGHHTWAFNTNGIILFVY